MNCASGRLTSQELKAGAVPLAAAQLFPSTGDQALSWESGYVESEISGDPRCPLWFVEYPAALKDSLRRWLKTSPDKITFGTDCFPYNDDDVLGAEESYWFGNVSQRQGLAGALTEMVSSGEITEAEAPKWLTPTSATPPSAFLGPLR